MKKLTKIAVILAAAFAFTACANSSNSSNSDDKKDSELSKYATDALLSDAEIAELTKCASITEISDGNWILQHYNLDRYPDVKTAIPEEEYNKIFSTLTDAEKAKVKTWINTTPKYQQEGCVTLALPYDTMSFIYTYKASTEGGKVKIKSGMKARKITISDENAVIKKFDSDYTWKGNETSSSEEIDRKLFKDIETEIQDAFGAWVSSTLMTNEAKDKFYAPLGDQRYFIIKQ